MVGVVASLLTLAAVMDPSEADVLAYGKRLNVKRIDPRLGSERLQPWVERTLGPGAEVTWSSGDCAEGGGDSAPTCLTAEANLRPRGRVVLSIVPIGKADQASKPDQSKKVGAQGFSPAVAARGFSPAITPQETQR